jgi:ATP-dependent Zn protease
MTISSSGSPAERKERSNDTSFSGRGDWKEVQSSITVLAVTQSKKRRQIVRECKAKTLALLTQHWSKVVAVADALTEKRVLSAEDIEAVLAAC